MRADLSRLKGKRVCVALSGGGDSVALFFYLKEHAAESGIVLSAVNVEHGIRGESSLRDTAFVRELCAREGAALYCFSADIPALAAESGRGVEEEARIFRRACFEKVLREGKADLVATAHHAGDNAESVLFNLFRGASLTGAGGIRAFVPVCGEKGIVRPLLGVPKAEITAYLTERALAYCKDESNADARYTRNFLRLRVLAPAAERFPHAEERLYAFSRDARADDDLLNAMAQEQLSKEAGGYAWSCSLPEPVFRRCLVQALGAMGVKKDVTRAHIEAALALRAAQSGARAALPAGLWAVREYDTVRLLRRAEERAPRYPFGEGSFSFAGGKVCISLREGAGEPHTGGRTLVLDADVPHPGGRTLVLDADALPQGCELRTPRTGDRFRKFGGGGKALKKYLVDKKIPARVRAALPVLAAGDEIYAVCGVEIAESVKVTAQTRRVCIITFEEKDHE